MGDGVAKRPKYFVVPQGHFLRGALHPSSLRRTYCTPHSLGFVRLVFGSFRLTISSISLMTFWSLAGLVARSFDFKL